MNKSIDFDDVADLYDYYVITDLDIPFFIEELCGQQEEVLELMCGTGRVSVPLLENGVYLTCVDYSSGMLDKFKEKLAARHLQARVVQADVRYLNLGKSFKFIFIPFNAFMELPGEDGQLRALQSIHQHLADDGIFICTLHNPLVRAKLATGEIIKRGEYNLPESRRLELYSQECLNKAAGVINGIQYFKIYDQAGRLVSERSLDIQFSLVEQIQFEAMAARSGFKAENLWGDYERSPYDPKQSPFMIYFLTKNG